MSIQVLKVESMPKFLRMLESFLANWKAISLYISYVYILNKTQSFEVIDTKA